MFWSRRSKKFFKDESYKDRLKELIDQRPLPGASSLMQHFSTLSSSSTVASFQNSFPIHHFESDDLSEFANTFYGNYDELKNKKDVYLALSLKVRKRGYIKGAEWRDVSPESYREIIIRYNEGKIETGNYEVVNSDTLSPFDQVRILVVLKKNDELNKPYPIKLAIHRTDSMPELEGPNYHGTVKELTRGDLLEGEEDYLGHLGFVFYPFYQLGKSSIMGVKPFASSVALTAGLSAYELIGGLKDMRYSFEICLGRSQTDHNHTRTTVLINPRPETPYRREVCTDKWWRDLDRGDESDEVLISVIPERLHMVPIIINGDYISNTEQLLFEQSLLDGVTDDNSNFSIILNNLKNSGETFSAPKMKTMQVSDENLLIEENFLLSRTQKTTYPDIFKGEVSAVATLSVNKGEYQLSNKTFNLILVEDRDLAFTSYNWKDPVELMVIFGVDDKDYDISDYKELSLNPNRFPFESQMIQLAGNNIKGPFISQSVQYLGYFKVTTPKTNAFDTNYNTRLKEQNLEFATTITEKEKSKFSKLITQLEKCDLKSVCMAGGSKWIEESGDFNGTKRHIFAVSYNFKYIAPNGLEISGLRPFTKYIEYKSNLEFGFRDLKLSRGGEYPGELNNGSGMEAIFEIKPPDSYFESVPWADSTQEMVRPDWKKKSLEEKKEIIKKWIENGSSQISYYLGDCGDIRDSL